MDKAWMFSVTLMALYRTASADDSTCTIRYNCTTGCERFKCQDLDGTCLNIKHEECIDGTFFYPGRGDWCKFYQVCKCCIKHKCDPQCVNGRCTADGVCECDECWHGPTCEEPYCLDGICQNGGTCLGPCGGCACEPGWTGPTCEEFECDPECQNGGICTGPNECECQPGYRGPTCEEFYCDNTCQNGGTCTGPNQCTCQPGWTGPYCEEFECAPGCQNGGHCTGPNECECPPGWTGPTCGEFYCEEECLNGGTCTGPNVCTCPPEYYGDVCQYIVCSERENCIGQSGTCYAKNHPILTNTTACPQQDNGRKWCTPMCACCFGA